MIENRIALVHGGVRDVQLYLKRPEHIARNAELLREDFPSARVCFFGHSHEQKVWQVADGRVEEVALDHPLSRERVYFINPGSVDAQRKHAHRLAECAIFDSGAWSIEFLRVRYAAAATEAKAAVGGYRIPPLTDRLYRWRRRLSPLFFSGESWEPLTTASENHYR